MAGTHSQSRRADKRVINARTSASGIAPLTDLDTQLMLQVRAGDRNAAGTLVRRNHERIARYLSRVVRDQRATEDLTQDVFLRVLSHADQYEPAAKLTTWLYRIATNTALNYLKQQRGRRVAESSPTPSPEIPDHRTAPPDEALSIDEMQRRVYDAILALPLKQRAALTLLAYEKLSYEQIASVLEVSVEAVRSLLGRARTTLREQLQGLF